MPPVPYRPLPQLGAQLYTSPGTPGSNTVVFKSEFQCFRIFIRKHLIFEKIQRFLQYFKNKSSLLLFFLTTMTKKHYYFGLSIFNHD